VAQLRAAQGGGGADEAAKKAQMEIQRLEAQKAEVIAQANAQKAVLAKEVTCSTCTSPKPYTSAPRHSANAQKAVLAKEGTRRTTCNLNNLFTSL